MIHYHPRADFGLATEHCSSHRNDVQDPAIWAAFGFKPSIPSRRSGDRCGASSREFVGFVIIVISGACNCNYGPLALERLSDA